jgi:hypothetical protein
MKRNPKEIIKELIEALPDWGKDQRFTILLGMELYASYTPPDGDLQIKTVRCDLCGQCCMDMTPNHKTQTPYGVDDEGKCNALKKERDGTWVCSAGLHKPYSCLQDPLKENTPECCIRYET